MGNVRRQVQQIAKREQELAEAKEAAEHEKLKVGAVPPTTVELNSTCPLVLCRAVAGH